MMCSSRTSRPKRVACVCVASPRSLQDLSCQASQCHQQAVDVEREDEQSPDQEGNLLPCQQVPGFEVMTSHSKMVRVEGWALLPNRTHLFEPLSLVGRGFGLQAELAAVRRTHLVNQAARHPPRGCRSCGSRMPRLWSSKGFCPVCFGSESVSTSGARMRQSRRCRAVVLRPCTEMVPKLLMSGRCGNIF